MAPPKSKARNAVAQSDNDTDFPANENLSIPLPPHRTNEQLNLAVLGRHTPDIKGILSIASYVVVYKFSPETQSWDKTGIEGTMFVAQLASSAEGAARFSVIVLNRRSMDNFDVELTTSDDVEITDDYIILQDPTEDGSLQIFGLWVFTEPAPSSTAHARDINAQMIKQCASMAENSRKTIEVLKQAANDAESSDEDLQSVPMGRQLSLRELFGQQRVSDAGFSIHHHAPAPSSIPKPSNFAKVQVQPQVQPQAQATQPAQQVVEAPSASSTPRFTNTPDTDFFLSAPKSAQAQRKPKNHHPARPKKGPKSASPPPAQLSADYANMTRNSELYEVFQKTRAEGYNGA